VDHLTSAQVDELRRRLTEEHERLRSRRREVIAAGDTAPPEPGDRQDRAVEEAVRSAELARVETDEVRLLLIERALARMDAGIYGLCEETNEPIPYARLEIDPATRYTVEVQEVLEAETSPPDEEPDEAY
jgi:DnaK suppressor protein